MTELRLSLKERVRLEVLGRVKRGEVSVARAAELAGVSLRQMRRLWARYKREGDTGVVHRLRGRASNNRLDEATREAVLKLYQEKYGDFGPTLACEKLAGEGYAVSPDTLTALLKGAGLWQRRRKRKKHRSRRERRASFGDMIQVDGSEHDWFEGRCGQGKCVLMVAIDDATGRVLARFYPRETLDAAFDLFGRWVAGHGLPRSVYADRAGIYRSDAEPTAEQLLAGEKPETQFGRAMRELAVALILARSPQAKGRVERVNRTLQDRLVKEMRLAGVNGIEAGNAFLDKTFLPAFNEKFAVEAADPADAHRPVSSLGPGVVLEEVLCEQEERVVGQDWCVRWDNRFLQISREHETLGLAGKRVLVKRKRDGSLVLEHKGVRLAWEPVPRRPSKPRPKPTFTNNKRYVPPENHPWKRGAASRVGGGQGGRSAAAPQADVGSPPRKTPQTHPPVSSAGASPAPPDAAAHQRRKRPRQ
jgi:transposase